MLELFALYLKEAEPIGRRKFFLLSLVIAICVSGAEKVTGNLNLAKFIIYLCSIPFMLICVYKRILDIEKGQLKSSNLFKLWLSLTCLLIVMNYYIAFYPIDRTNKLNLLWLTPPVIGIFALHIYLLFKRGHKAILAERNEQARLRGEQNAPNEPD